MKKISDFKSCVTLLNSVLVLVFASFMLDSLYSSDLLGVLGVWSLLFLIPLKVFVYSGIYSCLLMLISGEQLVVTTRLFFAQAKENWRIYFVVSLCPFLLSICLSIFSRGLIYIKPLNVSYCFDFVILSSMAILLFKKRKFQGGKLLWRDFVIASSDFMIMVGLMLLHVLTIYVTILLESKEFDIFWLFLFAKHYIHFLSYCFFCNCLIKQVSQISDELTQKQELFLINPLGGGIYSGTCSLFFRQYPPIFVCLKALTPKNYKIRELNRIFFSKRFLKPGKLVAITCYTSNCYEAYKIAKEYKREGSFVVMGGPHVSCCPDEALAFCDSVVLCGAEGVWEEVVRDYEQGTLKPKYFKEATDADYQKIHQELLKSPAWIVKDFLETTRGCKFKCYFCTDPFLNRGKILKKPINEMVELIKLVKKKYGVISFVDNNIFSDPTYSEALFNELKKLKLKWVGSCSIDIAKNDKMLLLAKESGCKSLLIGYEIFGNSDESNRGGKFALAKQYLDYSKKIKKAGIAIKAHFIYGFPTDSLKTLFQLWSFCFRLAPYWTAVGLLIPFPGSQFYHDIVKEGRLINLNWRRYNLYSLVFDHPKFKPSVMHFCFPFIHVLLTITTSKAGFIFIILYSISFYLIDIKGYAPF